MISVIVAVSCFLQLNSVSKFEFSDPTQKYIDIVFTEENHNPSFKHRLYCLDAQSCSIFFNYLEVFTIHNNNNNI